MAGMSLLVVVFFACISTGEAQLATCSDGFPPFDFGASTCTTAGTTSSSCTAPNACARLSDGSFACCGPTTSTATLPCQDGMRAPACTSWAANGFCSSTAYTADTKRAYCAATCGMCTCTDSAAACATWIRNNQFCTNPAYTLATRKTYCAASCGYCSG